MGKISNFGHDKSYFVTPAAQIACEKISYQAYFSHYTPSIIYDSIRIMQQLYIFFIGIFSYSIIRTLSDNISIC